MSGWRRVDGLNTLIDYRYQQHFKAKTGVHGMGRNRTGAKGADVTLKVPVGTQIFEEDNETLICDLTAVGQRFRLAAGGNGGFGNQHFKTSTNQAPRRANPGLPGEELTIWLRLKLIADAGLVGLPNAGKSTFLAAVTRGQAEDRRLSRSPRSIPSLGVARIDGREFVLADIPGLIEGAHEGVGIGDRFLGHVERTRVLLHLVSAPEETAGKAYKTVRDELEAYGNGLAEKPEIVALSQADIARRRRQRKKKAAALQARCRPRAADLSAATGEGVEAVLRALIELMAEAARGARPIRAGEGRVR